MLLGDGGLALVQWRSNDDVVGEAKVLGQTSTLPAVQDKSVCMIGHKLVSALKMLALCIVSVCPCLKVSRQTPFSTSILQKSEHKKAEIQMHVQLQVTANANTGHS
jgi:hypothetical protein